MERSCPKTWDRDHTRIDSRRDSPPSHIHTVLHQDTDATQAAHAGPTTASASGDDILLDPFSYPFCRVVDHRLDSNLHFGRGPVESTALPSPSHVPVVLPDSPPFPTPISAPSRPNALESQSIVLSSCAATAEISPVSHIATIIHHPILGNGPSRRQVQETEMTHSSIALTDYLHPHRGCRPHPHPQPPCAHPLLLRSPQSLQWSICQCYLY